MSVTCYDEITETTRTHPSTSEQAETTPLMTTISTQTDDVTTPLRNSSLVGDKNLSLAPYTSNDRCSESTLFTGMCFKQLAFSFCYFWLFKLMSKIFIQETHWSHHYFKHFMQQYWFWIITSSGCSHLFKNRSFIVLEKIFKDWSLCVRTLCTTGWERNRNIKLPIYLTYSSK